MKKIIALALIAVLSLSILSGCSQSKDDKKIVVGASTTPHAEILEIAKEVLAAKGFELVVKEFTDYVQPNVALESGELDANYFQHKPHMDDFNAEKKANLVSVAAIHYEPLGLYPGKTKSLDDLKDGAQIAIPGDTTNGARALLLLEANGLIKVDTDAGFAATANDIVENPKNLKILEIEAAQLARSLSDVDMAVINGNYAIQAGLNALTDALAKEEQDSSSADQYKNIVAVKAGQEESEKTKALVEALQSDEVREFIVEKYKGAVVSMD